MSIYPESLIAFASQLPSPLYAVGGCVRDTLLGKASHDIDLCSAMTPEIIRKYAKAAGFPCPLVNERLGTVLLCIDGRKYEHTTFRTESYPSGGNHMPEKIAFTESLEKDALRRDFSVNAIYQNVLTGELCDPCNGIDDLKNRILRTTTEDPSLILKDDGLRILRLVRFAISTGFSVDPKTLAAAKEYASLLDDIAWERKREEFDRILLLDDPLRGLEMLTDVGALFLLIPELRSCDGLLQREDYHRHDVLRHLFHTCACMPPVIEYRLMGLLHDIGKPAAFERDGNYYHHADMGSVISETVLRRLVYPNAIIRRIKTAVRWHMFDLDGNARESTVRKRFVSIGRQGTEDLILLREADILGSGIQTDYKAAKFRRIYSAMLSDGCPWSADELALSGSELMEALKLSPSREIALIKEKLLLHCVCHPLDNRPEKLLQIARDICVKKA